MHTRRIATFLLGIWMGCSVLVGIAEIENLRFSSSILAAPSDEAAPFIKKAGGQDLALLLRYELVEQSRRYTYIWEEVELGLALVLGGFLFAGTQKRIFPVVFCALLFLLVMFEHFGITPELTYRGRAADFPPGNATLGAQMRLVAMGQIYASVEAVKLLLGAVLSSYLFVFRARSKSHKEARLGDLARPGRERI